MKKLSVVALLVLMSAPLTACFLGSFGPLPMDVNRKNEYLEYSWGGIVKDCQGNALSSADSLSTKAFWDNNHLPHGTIDFVCVDGKAYLPGQQPKAK
ncbi:hypothetical protein [Acinetobacter rudis]|uniref:Lipoprotein n=1 Tax=Acinetobacter rudis CIP 110305 TaxID=421052 RepID=S3N818_9GAMM|nr:hypothetical protein [Acinetobacter rudis]EPF74538.1 hypothetical protein F945_01577 [Acinetobacter rudis CIP 110305]